MFPIKCKEENYVANMQNSPMLSNFVYGYPHLKQGNVYRGRHVYVNTVSKALPNHPICFPSNDLICSRDQLNVIQSHQKLSLNDNDRAASEAYSEGINISRAKRMFVPNDRKDWQYWIKRSKNNDSARRSRIKRKSFEEHMEKKLLRLQKENIELRNELLALKKQFGCDNPETTVANENKTENVTRGANEAEDSIEQDNDQSMRNQEIDYCSFSPEEDEYRSTNTFPAEWYTSDDGKSCSSDSSDHYIVQIEKFQKIPHKFRLKMHIHSAFTVNDAHQ